MKEENVIFENQGQKISGVLHTPEKETKSAIVICHGFKGDKNGYRNRNLKMARKLCENGFAVLRFDFRGCGASDGEFVDTTITDEVEDLKFVIEFLQKQGYEKIGAIGGSFGGAICVLSKSAIKCMVLWAPALDKQWIFNEKRISKEKIMEARTKGYVLYVSPTTGDENKVGKAMIEEFERLDIFNAMKNVSCPILIIHGSDDKVVNYKQSEKYIRFVSGQKQLKIVPEADHSFATPQHEQELMEATIEWFNKWLK